MRGATPQARTRLRQAQKKVAYPPCLLRSTPSVPEGDELAQLPVYSAFFALAGAWG